MKKAQKESDKLKCRDCTHCKMESWCDPRRFCLLSMRRINPNAPACIQVSQKLSARERRECLTQ